MVAKVPLETTLMKSEDPSPPDDTTFVVQGHGNQIAPIDASRVLARIDEDRLNAVFLTVIRR